MFLFYNKYLKIIANEKCKAKKLFIEYLFILEKIPFDSIKGYLLCLMKGHLGNPEGQVKVESLQIRIYF